MTQESANPVSPQKYPDENAQLRAALADAEQRYTDLLENTGESIFIIDLESYTILEANHNAARRLGYTVKELIGLSLDEIEVIHVQSANGMAWESSFSGTQVYECHYRHKSGELIPVEVSSRRIQSKGSARIQNVVRNIALRKQMEAERTQLIADLESFAHTVAHDLKTPLANIFTTADWLSKWERFDEDATRPYLQILSRSSHHAIQIVDSLLLFASVRQQSSVPLAPIDMRTILTNIQHRFAPMIERHNATLIIPDQFAVAVGYDPWVEEIWANYVSNAIKYGGVPPIIEIGSEQISADVVRFWVRDNGRGIPAEQIPTLFDRFNRLDQVGVDGHGLGLSIVRRIVEKLGGEVNVKSVVGEGSEFSFTLPVEQ